MTALTTDFVNLYATTPSGQQIKSSTFHIIQEGKDGYNLALGTPALTTPPWCTPTASWWT